MRIDPEANAFINGGFNDAPDTEEAPDVFAKFLADAQLAGAFGHNGHRHVHNFRSETSIIDREFAALRPPSLKIEYGDMRKAAADLDEEIIPDSQRLEKSGDRRKANLAAWVRGELAVGRTIRELADYAQRHDPETAALIRTIGDELNAA